MSLQRRLTLFFVLIVILPLTAAALVMQRAVVDRFVQAAADDRRAALDAAVPVFRQRVKALDERVAAAAFSRRVFTQTVRAGRARLGRTAGRDRASVERRLGRLLEDESVMDFVIALDREGAVAGSALERPRYLDGFGAPGARAIVASERGIGNGFFRTAEISVGRQGSLMGGLWLDGDLLGILQRRPSHMSLVSNGTVIASTSGAPVAVGARVTFEGPFAAELGQPVSADARHLGGQGADVAVVASTPTQRVADAQRGSLTAMVQLLALALMAILVLAHLLARVITQPLMELTAGATAVAGGDLDYEMEVHSIDEVGKLASSFNYMTAQLRATIRELSASRDRLQRAVFRVGETLRSTSDTNSMLASILNMAGDAVEAEAAVLWMPTPTGGELYPAVAEGLDLAQLRRVPLASGGVGMAARTGAPLKLNAGAASAGEPALPVGMAVPMPSREGTPSVLALYRHDAGKPFTDEDRSTVVFLAEQGGVAIENVMLHEEARRLSLTDGLTGVWNRRYVQIQFRKELAGAIRYERPFSLLLLDLDHFKDINDSYGHQCGDEVLVELSQRVDNGLREVDTFARFGGEEFLCLLSETDEEGALIKAEKIRKLIKSAPVERTGGQPIAVTVSIGVATFPFYGESFDTLLHAADRALYRAKRKGRDQVCLADPPRPGLKIAT